MKRLIIIGAGGFGREVLIWALDNPVSTIEWQVAGFLDSRTGILDGFAKAASQVKDHVSHSVPLQDKYHRGFPILGDPLTYSPRPDDVFICALGDPGQRRKYAEPLLSKGGNFITLFHPKAEISVFAAIGRGSIIGPFASISPDARLGEFVVVNSYTGIGHDAAIGNWSTIDGHCLLAGHAHIGEETQVHGGSVITPGARIGNRAKVGAGSVVIGKVPDGITVFGNPARRFDWRGGS